jgi:catechol 2,3-dioxygenase-like lactoylglutathione lyase family enzyme
VLSVEDVYHTGFVVPDIEKAMAEFSAVFGLAWTPVEEVATPVRTPQGSLTAPLRFTYSRGPAPRIELLEPVPGTVWEQPVQPVAGPSSAHHVGVWCDDFRATSAALDAAGSPCVLTFDDGSGLATRFAYHRLPNGALVELIDATRRPALEEWFAGGPYPAAASGA